MNLIDPFGVLKAHKHSAWLFLYNVAAKSKPYIRIIKKNTNTSNVLKCQHSWRSVGTSLRQYFVNSVSVVRIISYIFRRFCTNFTKYGAISAKRHLTAPSLCPSTAKPFIEYTVYCIIVMCGYKRNLTHLQQFSVLLKSISFFFFYVFSFFFFYSSVACHEETKPDFTHPLGKSHIDTRRSGLGSEYSPGFNQIRLDSFSFLFNCGSAFDFWLDSDEKGKGEGFPAEKC